MEQKISPPPTKRRRLSEAPVQFGTTIAVSLEEDSTPSTIRLFAWNIDGISHFVQSQELITSFFPTLSPSKPSANSSFSASLRTFLRRHSFPHVLFLQEVKINPSDTATQRAVSASINSRLDAQDERHGPEYVVHFTLPKDKYNARAFGGRTYGVASILRKDFYDAHVLNVRDVPWDLEGRVSVVELRNKLALWNIYFVNGTDKPYRNPKTGKVEGTRHDRKLAFHKLLMEECIELETEGWTHVLAADFNVAPARIDAHPNLRTWPAQHVVNRADFNFKFLDESNEAGLRAVDVWRALKGGEKKYTYCPRGREWASSCDRVDLILVSRKLWKENMVMDVGILDSVQERGPSDHVPLWVEVNYGGTEGR